jgi:hypothetical protein
VADLSGAAGLTCSHGISASLNTTWGCELDMLVVLADIVVPVSSEHPMFIALQSFRCFVLSPSWLSQGET